MKRKIGFWNEVQGDTDNITRPKEETPVSVPKKSLVQVYFPKRGMNLSYYNDQFDLQVGDTVYVDGKLEGLRGCVTALNYSFKIKLSDYKRVIAVADTHISRELRMAGSHLVAFDPQTIPYGKIITWFKAPDKEDDVCVSCSDDHGFRLDDLSGMKVTGAIAERGHDYYAENRVVYLCMDRGYGRGIVEGTSPYEIEFDYGGGEIKNLTCSCYCGYPCKHSFAAMLQLRETLKLLEQQDGFDWNEGGYRRWESSVEEALIEMYLAGVSVRRVEDITEALWGSKVSPATISELNKKAYVHIEDWRNRPLQGGRYPYVYVDGLYLRRNWGGEYENVAILVAIAVNEDGYREVLGAAEGMKEDKASWVSFFQWLRDRGLDGVKLVVGDKCLGMLEAVGEVFPEAKYQRCTVHFYRNVFSAVPRSEVKLVAKMLKAIHAQESKKAAREKAKAVVEELHTMKLKEAAKKVEDGIEETLTYCDFPCEHWTRIRTNNVIERLNREIRRRTRVVGCFPDGNSALMLVCARLRHVAGTQWGNKKYMNMKHLEAVLEDTSIAG